MTRIRTISKVLQLKDHQKDELEIQAKKVLHMLAAEEERLRVLEKNYSLTAAGYEEKQRTQSMKPHEMELYLKYFRELFKKMELHKKKIMQRMAELKALQDDLISAYKDKKLLEALKEKVTREEIREKELSEQKEMDFNYLLKRHGNGGRQKA